MLVRTKQCKACPWKKSTVPSRDIPNGYCAQKHARLKRTQASGLEGLSRAVLRVMACHETPVGREAPCVGWLAHELGPGNNLALRLAVRGQFRGPLVLDGEQHESFEATLGKGVMDAET